MSKLVLYAAPTVEPVTPRELMLHARIDGSEEIELIAQLLVDARNEVEKLAWRKLLTQTWDQYFDGFEDDELRLDCCPVQSITAITYVDPNGVTQTLAADQYELGECRGLPEVRTSYAGVWPVARDQDDVVKVRYKAGYGDAASSVPAELKAAIRIHAAHRFRFRDGTPLPRGFYDLVQLDDAKEFR
jgi:uncharacterized phiE125 gp8 family phage protein